MGSRTCGHLFTKGMGVLLLLLIGFPAAAAGETIKGKVVAYQDARAKIEYAGKLSPNIDDAVEIGFELDGELIPMEGRWKIVKVDAQFAWAAGDGGGQEEPQIDYVVRIQSPNPKSRKEGDALASRHGLDDPGIAPPKTAIVFEKGYDLPGGEYLGHHAGVSNVQGCLELCSQNENCVAFTWVKPNVQGPTGVCWLKSSLSRKARNDACVSGVVREVEQDDCEWRKTGTAYSCFCQNRKTKKWYETNPGACP